MTYEKIHSKKENLFLQHHCGKPYKFSACRMEKNKGLFLILYQLLYFNQDFVDNVIFFKLINKKEYNGKISQVGHFLGLGLHTISGAEDRMSLFLYDPQNYGSYPISYESEINITNNGIDEIIQSPLFNNEILNNFNYIDLIMLKTKRPFLSKIFKDLNITDSSIHMDYFEKDDEQFTNGDLINPIYDKNNTIR